MRGGHFLERPPAIDLDRVHRAEPDQDGTGWTISRRKNDGTYTPLVSWTGGRRSLLQHCEDLDIHPSRDAEQVLARIPESSGFKERN